MPERPHIAFPPRLTSGGRLAVNEQDSDEDVASGIAVILSWPRGTRRGKPDFGVPPPLFEQAELSELRDAVMANEPRAATIDPELLDTTMRRGIESIRFGFNQGSE